MCALAVVAGKVFSKNNADGTAATKASLFAGSALRVGNVLLYFLLPHEHVKSYPQSQLPAAVCKRRSELVEAFKAHAPATEQGEEGELAAAGVAQERGGSPDRSAAGDAAAGSSPSAKAKKVTATAAPSPPEPELLQSGSESSPSGPLAPSGAAADSSSATPALQRPLASPQLPESAPAEQAAAGSTSPADDEASKSGKTPVNNSGMTYRQILDIVISSLPPGKWSARDLSTRALQLLPEGSVTNKTAFNASLKNVLRGLERFSGDLSAEEIAAAAARGNKRIAGALWYVTGPGDLQSTLTPHMQSALAARIAELAASGDGFLTASATGEPLTPVAADAPSTAVAANDASAEAPADDRAAKREREAESRTADTPASAGEEEADSAEPEAKRKAAAPPTAVLDGEGGFSL